MRINHNITSMNAHAQMTSNSAMASKNMEKLSSGLRINKAGDDAAGLAISEKMRAQVRGLDQASRNSQDAISMIQTAEGALNETHAILQRMRELATQAGNDTNVTVDRNEIQKEINQLSSEINRIGNTTEFNTQKLLKGGGTTGIARTGMVSDGALSGGAAEKRTQAEVQIKLGGGASGNVPKGGEVINIGIGGQMLKVTFNASGTSNQTTGTAYNVTANSAVVNVKGLSGASQTWTSATVGAQFENTVKAFAEALSKSIELNDTLKGNVTVGYTGTGSGTKLVVKAVAGGTYDGAAGRVNASGSVIAESGNHLKHEEKGIITNAMSGSGIDTGASGTYTIVQSGSTTDAEVAAKDVSFSSYSSTPDLVGKGFTVNGKSVEFYDASKGAYTGNNVGVNVSAVSSATTLVDAIVKQAAGKLDGVALSIGSSASTLKVSSTVAGVAGNNIKVTDGSTAADFNATFQVGANKGQSFSVSVGDMRSKALGITANAGTAGFSNSNNVTDGTNSVLGEASLDVSTASNAANSIQVINNAIEKVSAQRSQLGAFQNRLEHTINNLTTSSQNLTAAESRIRDVDMAKEMMQFTKNNILNQAAQAMLSQANQQPQGVLQLLR